MYPVALRVPRIPLIKGLRAPRAHTSNLRFFEAWTCYEAGTSEAAKAGRNKTAQAPSIALATRRGGAGGGGKGGGEKGAGQTCKKHSLASCSVPDNSALSSLMSCLPARFAKARAHDVKALKSSLWPHLGCYAEFFHGLDFGLVL